MSSASRSGLVAEEPADGSLDGVERLGADRLASLSAQDLEVTVPCKEAASGIAAVRTEQHDIWKDSLTGVGLVQKCNVAARLR
jgi:hypothetical protein